MTSKIEWTKNEDGSASGTCGECKHWSRFGIGLGDCLLRPDGEEPVDDPYHNVRHEEDEASELDCDRFEKREYPEVLHG